MAPSWAALREPERAASTIAVINGPISASTETPTMSAM
jgi:hypothetical protein